MPGIQRGNSLQLHDLNPADNQVRNITSDNMPLKPNIDSALLFNDKARLAQFDSQGIFINLFHKPSAKPIGNGKSTANDQPRQPIIPGNITVHPLHP